MEKYLINEHDSAIVFLPLMKYKDNIEIIKAGIFKTLIQIKVFGTAEELEPIKEICKKYHVELQPILEEDEGPVDTEEEAEEDGEESEEE